MKPVLFRYWDTVERRFIAQPIRGVFHQWGSTAHEVGDTIAAQTVGIIEDAETGHCYEVPVDEIRFIKGADQFADIHKMD